MRRRPEQHYASCDPPFLVTTFRGEDVSFRLLTHEKFARFGKRPLADPLHATGAPFTLGVDSREAVDVMVNLGGTRAHEAPQVDRRRPAWEARPALTTHAHLRSSRSLSGQ